MLQTDTKSLLIIERDHVHTVGQSINRWYRPTVGQASANSVNRYHWSMLGWHDCRYSVGGMVVMCRWHIGEMSVKCQWDVGEVSVNGGKSFIWCYCIAELHSIVILWGRCKRQPYIEMTTFKIIISIGILCRAHIRTNGHKVMTNSIK